MRWAAYAGVSVTLAAGVLVKALSERPNFYSAAVYLSQSSANLMILTNLIFLCACVVLLGLQKLLYGPLRPIEIEQLYERAWLFVTETCLSMTIFRGSFGAWFMVMFFSLLVGKVWSWIGEGRVEILEQQPPANPRLFHIRLAISLSLSALFATSMLEFSIKTVLAQAKPDMMVMFGFEFAILTILATSTAARYCICLAEIYITRKQRTARLSELREERAAANESSRSQEPESSPSTSNEHAAQVEVEEADVEVEGWEGKGRWIFYLDMVTDFFKLTVYLTFFSVLLRFYGLPLHIMRDLFLSFRSFFKRVADFVRYRNATRDMNARYPDATPDEVAREDVCIICREEMRSAASQDGAGGAPQRASPIAERMRPKKLPCGHILHFSCLRSWLERQQNCPTCRRPVLATQRIQVQAGNGPEQAGAAALPAHGADQPGRNRARVINFGPLRIGFGAGGGNLIDELAQRIHDGEQRQPADAPGHAGGQQRFGFGFGFGRRPNPRNQNLASPSTAPVETQLDQIERSIQQQISGLQVASNELHLVRMLNNELFRLRNLQATVTNGEAAVPQMPTTTPASLPHLNPGQLPHTASHLPPTILSSQSQRSLSSESVALPEGMALPPGWTLMPLHRHDGLQRSGMHDGSAAVSSNATSGIASTAQARHTPSESHESPNPDNHVRPRSPPLSTASNGTHLAARAMDQPTSQPGTAALPSWHSDSHHANGKHQAEQISDAMPLKHGQVNSDEAANSTSSTGSRTEKGKSKVATVEELVDDVD